MQPRKKKQEKWIEIGSVKPITPKRILRPVPVPVKEVRPVKPVPVPAPTTLELLRKAEQYHVVGYGAAIGVRKLMRRLKKASGEDLVKLQVVRQGVHEQLRKNIRAADEKAEWWDKKAYPRVKCIAETVDMLAGSDAKRAIGAAPPELRRKIDELRAIRKDYSKAGDLPTRRVLAAQMVELYDEIKGPVEKETELMRECHERAKKLEERNRKK